MEKELDDICTGCPNIDAIKRHKQQVDAIKEYTQWLKKEPRTSYFFLFRLYTHIQNTFIPQKQQLSFTPGNSHSPESDVPPPDLTLSRRYHCDYGYTPYPMMGGQTSVLTTTSETTSSTNAVPGKTVTGNETEKHENAVRTTFPASRSAFPPEHLRFATGFPSQPLLAGPRETPMRTVHPYIYSEIIWFCSRYLLNSGPQVTKTIINSVFSEWARISNDYPTPFSWVDSRDSEQCDWLWNAMQVRCVGTPLNPLTPEQKYWFACATFDNWEGWNEQQVQFLLESNPRRNRAKFTQTSFQAPGVQHKAILLDELKSAREQQKRRDERADGSVPLKLSGKIHKQLESIARSRGVPPKKMLNEMIEQAYQDLVATRQNSQNDSR
ncbi:hypothetical protein [Escherichia coli]|uniref:hypothetical protein n=1 Tax=Escherichia coli TaxID=562 RepID=UPI000BE35EC1|nr:hypothetical protein [Escherichia coli]EFO1500183.1 hypothetical protein [Escherichia coli]EGK4221708.1 hypothetical protein [Escherichia coli]